MLEQLILNINEELRSALKVIKLPIERIDRLTDKSSTNDLVVTYKLRAPIKKAMKGKMRSLSGGTLSLDRGKWVYTCKTFGHVAEGEKVVDIVANLKHPYHQELKHPQIF